MKMTEYLLGDVCSRLSSGKSIKSSQVFEKGRFPVFGGNGIRGYTDTFNFSGECAIVGRQGAYCGNVQFYKGCAYMTEHAVVVCGNQKSNTKFLGLVLQKMNLGRLSHQAAQPGLSVKILAAQKIKLPAIETQTKIAQILTAYDDLIETNQKQIKLLEEAAQRLYKEWFVDLRFPGHEKIKIIEGIPEGWKEKAIEDICDSIGGGTPSTKNSEYYCGGKIKWVTPTDITRKSGLILLDTEKKITEEGLRSSSAKMVPPYTILMTSRASVGFFGLCEHEVCTNQGFISCVPYQEKVRPYLLHNLMSRVDEVRAKASGSTFLEISKKTFRALRIILPSDCILETFNKQIWPMVKQMEALTKSIVKLQETRDRLLPKLMSGEMEV